jgi:hypothetical protein
MRAAWPLSLVLLVAAAAGAGTEQQPEMTDPPGDAGAGAAWGDIVAGWLNDSATDVSATMKLAQLAAQPPGTAWFFVADVGSGANATFGWGAFLDEGAALNFFYGHWDRQAGPTDIQEGAGEVKAAGANVPGYVTALLPKAFADNATAGAKLTGFAAGTGQLTPVDLVGTPVPLPLPGAAGFVSADDAAGSDYTLASGPGTNATSPGPAAGGASPANATGSGAPPPARTPGPQAALTLAVLAAAAWTLRRRAP